MTSTLMEPKPVVVFDMDGVLCDFALGFSRLASSMFLFPVFDTSKQESWKEFRRRGLSYDELGRVWDKVDSSEFWWETLEPFATVESDRTWMHLLAEFAELHYITNRKLPDNVGLQTTRWLLKHNFPLGAVHVVEEKADYVNEFFGDRLWGAIDDSPYNIRGYARLGLPLYVREWQFNADIHPELPRVSGVKEFCRIMLEKTNE